MNLALQSIYAEREAATAGEQPTAPPLFDGPTSPQVSLNTFTD